MSDKCNAEIFTYGESAGFIDATKQEAEEFCYASTMASPEYKYDWHYFAGRVHVKRLRKDFKAPEAAAQVKP